MDAKAIEKRLFAAQQILQNQTVSKETFYALRTLLHGVHPKIDLHLASAGKALTHIEKIQRGDVIALTIESLPEDTVENKKRKKAIIFFLKFWNDLKGEVKRVQAEFHGNFSIGKIIAGAKGPLGLITLIAAGVAALQLTSVEIRIKNSGCETIHPVVSFPVKIPGLTLPDTPIPSGGEGVAKLPPLTLTADGTKPNAIHLTGYGISYNFTLGTSGISLFFDGQPLNGNKTTLALGSSKEHELLIECR